MLLALHLPIRLADVRAHVVTLVVDGPHDLDRLVQRVGHVRQLAADLLTGHALDERTLGRVLLLCHAQVGAERKRRLVVVDAHLSRAQRPMQWRYAVITYTKSTEHDKKLPYDLSNTWHQSRDRVNNRTAHI